MLSRLLQVVHLSAQCRVVSFGSIDVIKQRCDAAYQP